MQAETVAYLDMAFVRPLQSCDSHETQTWDSEPHPREASVISSLMSRTVRAPANRLCIRHCAAARRMSLTAVRIPLVHTNRELLV
jgi:hypothetical protein